MIFDSLGIGEMGVVLALAVVLVEPKKLGKVMKEFGKFKRKVSQIQSDVKSQLDAITRDEDMRERNAQTKNDKISMRQWGQDQVKSLAASVRADGSRAVAEKIAEWPAYTHAKVISCFVGSLNEIDTDPLLRRILADGKTLLIPYVLSTPVVKPERETEPTTSAPIMRMAAVTDLEGDLVEGTFGLREPRLDLRVGGDDPKPDLIFVPGTCFDQHGGRLGQGLGYYDRYLTLVRGLKVGLGFDVQITQKNLALEAHDQLLDVLISEKRLSVFSAPRMDESMG